MMPEVATFWVVAWLILTAMQGNLLLLHWKDRNWRAVVVQSLFLVWCLFFLMGSVTLYMEK